MNARARIANHLGAAISDLRAAAAGSAVLRIEIEDTIGALTLIVERAAHPHWPAPALRADAHHALVRLLGFCMPALLARPDAAVERHIHGAMFAVHSMFDP